jgi:hypothetical protein
LRDEETTPVSINGRIKAKIEGRWLDLYKMIVPIIPPNTAVSKCPGVESTNRENLAKSDEPCRKKKS